MIRFGEMLTEEEKEISWEELRHVEKYLNGVWKHLGIDFELTRHFFERVNDPRNKKPITATELVKIFTDAYKKYGKMIAGKVTPETEKTFDSVLTDLSTKINSPVVVEWDKKARELVMKAKTVMRVNHFYTHPDQQRLTVQHYEPENTMKSKTYTDLKEWIGFNTPEVAPIAAPQAVDDVDTAAFSVEQPDVLDKLNAYCMEIANHQYINPYYPLNALWKKLSLIGVNFNLKSIMMVGPQGQTSVPLNRFGGRYGTLGGPEYISKDDGTGVPGGLNLVVSWTKTGGVYSLTVQIEHGASALPFGEEVVAEGVYSYGNPEKFDKKFANTHASLVHHGFNTKGADSNGVTVYNHKTKGNIMIGPGSNPRWSHISGKGLNSQGHGAGEGHASLKKHLETKVKPDYDARRKNLMKVHEDEEVVNEAKIDIHSKLVHHGFNIKGTDSNGVTVYNHKTKGNIMIGPGPKSRWSHVSGKGLNSEGHGAGEGMSSLKKHLDAKVKPDYDARRKNLMKVHEDEEVKKK